MKSKAFCYVNGDSSGSRSNLHKKGYVEVQMLHCNCNYNWFSFMSMLGANISLCVCNQSNVQARAEVYLSSESDTTKKHKRRPDNEDISSPLHLSLLTQKLEGGDLGKRKGDREGRATRKVTRTMWMNQELLTIPFRDYIRLGRPPIRLSRVIQNCYNGCNYAYELRISLKTLHPLGRAWTHRFVENDFVIVD